MGTKESYESLQFAQIDTDTNSWWTGSGYGEVLENSGLSTVNNFSELSSKGRSSAKTVVKEDSDSGESGESDSDSESEGESGDESKGGDSESDSEDESGKGAKAQSKPGQAPENDSDSDDGDSS